MSELKLGDQVASGEGRFSPIIAFLHRDLDTQAEYVALTYVVGEQQQTIELTADHRIFVWNRHEGIGIGNRENRCQSRGVHP